MNKIKFLFESNMFGVCSRIGEKLNFSTSRIRMYFIYASFFTFGSPVIIYLILAFWIEMKTQYRKHQNPSVWEF